MRKLFVFLITVAMMMTIGGCSSSDKKVIKHDYLFKGENENWQAEYHLDATEVFYREDGILKYDNEAEKKLTISYKKDIAELASVKEVEISYKTRTGGGYLSEEYSGDDFLEKGTFVLKSGGKGGALENKEDIIKVEINLDGKVETIELVTDYFQGLREKYFDFAIEHRLDYLPVFEKNQAPTDSAEYLFYAFMINFDNWGENKGIMTKEYVEEIIQTYFKVENITHSPLHKGWDYDGEKYIAIPGGVNEEPIYVLREYYTSDQKDRTIYHLTMDYCIFVDKDGVGIIPSEEDLEKIRENILAGDLSKLQVLRSEEFSYYLDNNQVVFLSHTLKEY